MNIIPENEAIAAFHAQTVEQLKSKNQVRLGKTNK
jgi:hypothetical protein